MSEPTTGQRLAAYGVHVLTASGIAFAFLAAAETTRPGCDPRLVFVWLIAAVIVDAIDGPLARRAHVKTRAADIDGRTIDDIVDYITFTFLPLLLVWRMGWVPEPKWLFVVPPMMASLLGFANVGAKEEDAGFFRGFPSYWNIAAFYCGLLAASGFLWASGLLLLALAVLTVAPVRFVYPNLAPRPWKTPLRVGAYLWMVIVLWMLWEFPENPAWLVGVSLVYPAVYAAASVWLDVRDRRQRGEPRP